MTATGYQLGPWTLDKAKAFSIGLDRDPAAIKAAAAIAGNAVMSSVQPGPWSVLAEAVRQCVDDDPLRRPDVQTALSRLGGALLQFAGEGA